MKARPLILSAFLGLAAFVLVACARSDERTKKEIIETVNASVGSNDPRICTENQTLRFDEQIVQMKGKGAIEACREKAEAGEFDERETAGVFDVSTDGDEATATLGYAGGSLDSQSLKVSLVEDDGDWKLDHIDGFAGYHAKPLVKSLEGQLTEGVGGLTPAQAKCFGDAMIEGGAAKAEALFFSGSNKEFAALVDACS